MKRGNFAHEVMEGLGILQTIHTRRAWQALMQAEGGSARNNPFNTTLKLSGSTNYNSVGVQNYQSGQQGVAATIRTLREDGHGYGKILALMRDNAPAPKIIEAWGASDWGTATSLALAVLADIKEDRHPNTLQELEAKQIAT